MNRSFTISESKAAAKGSLADAMGAVSAALSAVPDNVVTMPRTSTEAFLLVDPVLSVINRQLLDARAHNANILSMLGAGDPMMDALSMQIAALEEAYATRLAALKKRREEGRKSTARKHEREEREQVSSMGVKNLSVVRGQTEKPKRSDEALWLWVFIAVLLANQATMKKSGPRLEAA